MQEIWKSVEGYVGLYEVSDLGNFRRVDGHHKSHPIGRCLKTHLSSYGYPMVWLYASGKAKYHLAHRLVAYAFCGLTRELIVNHKNGIRNDNRAENLESVTASQNERHKWETLRTGARTNAKINHDDALDILRLSAGGMSNSSIAGLYGLSRMSVWNIVNGRTWKTHKPS